jgi:hypothetical protein
MEEGERGFTCNTQGERRYTAKISVGKSKEKEHFEKLNVDGNIAVNPKSSIRESTD